MIIDFFGKVDRLVGFSIRGEYAVSLLPCLYLGSNGGAVIPGDIYNDQFHARVIGNEKSSEEKTGKHDEKIITLTAKPREEI